MSDDTIPVTVEILERDYRVTCPIGEEDALQESARYLNERMQEIKNSGKVIGIDRIAVMVALNITHELLKTQPDTSSTSDDTDIGAQLKALQERIDQQLDTFQVQN